MAENPLVVPCPAGAWTKVADNKTSGTIHKTSVAPSLYKITFKVAGQAAPTGAVEGVLVFGKSDQSIIDSDAGIDVYIQAVKFAGEVSVDL